MTAISGSTLETLSALVFQFSGSRLEFVSREMPAGITGPKLSKIVRGEWQRIIPEEFHPVVRKLALLPKSQGHATVEFPVYWMGNTIWLRVFAASEPQQKGKTKVVGLAQNVTLERQTSLDTDSPHDATAEQDHEHFRKLRHDINGALTTIVMNCELLLDENCAPDVRRRIGSILAEALRMDQFLRQYYD
ncbi:MAG: hypothetical protein HYX72_00945 [Acidobacteria bacterium]|nr:hypothetical protein [Acidobacteriota bacterium]